MTSYDNTTHTVYQHTNYFVGSTRALVALCERSARQMSVVSRGIALDIMKGAVICSQWKKMSRKEKGEITPFLFSLQCID